MVDGGVDLLIPVKMLHAAKSRLLGALDGGARDPRLHSSLVIALALDTATAAREAVGVRRVHVLTADSTTAAAVRADGFSVVTDHHDAGLNAALRHGSEWLRNHVGADRIGALQADLPALTALELGAAIAAAGQSRGFCPDRQGTGTTFLLAARGEALDPRFGVGSARRHREAGAVELRGSWPTLRCDVDTAADLGEAASLGLGPRTAELFERADQVGARRPARRGA
ncbi:2-phospho-L-lactate guanylyltransferase [Actinoalloteichus sp. AHMU CJ021]|uniref:2-phospho-L-lactate guanylyltransferase n=1 Tax=Actinoalloteichus TaxID=65496 RepID=UPI0009DEEADF|nr:2-phospho-L-lactate guanylyltransferase [Actinoalloteichus caeruleus]AUS78062.1 2-phospho-L-lactate guanylyltransferase [Actinoalloteichus sp. AHMU CJ021]